MGEKLPTWAFPVTSPVAPDNFCNGANILVNFNFIFHNYSIHRREIDGIRLAC